MTGGASPVVVEVPGMQLVGIGVFPEDVIGAVDVGSSEGLPTAVNTFMDMCAVGRLDSDGIAAVYRDREKAIACSGFF